MFGPCLPDRLVRFKCETESYQPRLRKILADCHHTQNNQSSRPRLRCNLKSSCEEHVRDKSSDEGRGSCRSCVEENGNPALTEMASGTQSVRGSNYYRRLRSIKKERQENKTVSDGDRRINARNFDCDARTDEDGE